MEDIKYTERYVILVRNYITQLCLRNQRAKWHKIERKKFESQEEIFNFEIKKESSRKILKANQREKCEKNRVERKVF